MTTAGPDARPVLPGPVPHRRTTLIWTLLVPALLTLAGLLVVWSWRGELPDPVASHWGADGVDGYSALPPLVLGIAATTAVFCLVMAGVGAFAGQAAMTRRFACGMAVWFAGFMQVTLLASLVGQRGLADASAAPSGGGQVALGAVVVSAAALAVACLVPGDTPRPARSVPPADAPRLALGDSESAVWVRRAGPRHPAAMCLAVVAPALIVGAMTGTWWLSGAIAVVVGAVVAAMLQWTVTVDRDGLAARSVVRAPVLRVPLDEIERADVVPARPFAEFGGWGLRTGRDGTTGVVVRGGDALRVHRTGGRRVVVTVDDAATAAALLNTLASRREVPTD
ncbi:MULTISPECIES: DUF1648 domain-containing protein [unclassified Actinotalea]|uniref:DUF1648 domain-containing protein n=1 Tax=unclassified Actinotalea TaxID=2638618 RepID=UPI0015F56FDD|nr:MULTISPECIES: DUF1648 domain-containing protein [unclassified Actinotalea]